MAFDSPGHSCKLTWYSYQIESCYLLYWEWLFTAKSYFCWKWIIYHVVNSHQTWHCWHIYYLSIVICTNYFPVILCAVYFRPALFLCDKWNIMRHVMISKLVLILLKYIMMYKITFWLFSFCMMRLVNIILNSLWIYMRSISYIYALHSSEIRGLRST